MAFVALLTSLKITNAWPLVFNVFRAIMSNIWPNCEKMAYNDFFKSAINKKCISRIQKRLLVYVCCASINKIRSLILLCPWQNCYYHSHCIRQAVITALYTDLPNFNQLLSWLIQCFWPSSSASYICSKNKSQYE